MHVSYFLELLFGGLLAGFEIAVHYGVGTSPRSLAPAEQIRLRQAMIRRLRILAPALFLPTFALALLITVQKRNTSGLGWHSVGLAALLVWAFIRVVRTISANKATLAWAPEAPPENWSLLIQQTEQFHVVAAWTAVIAFACFLVTALAKR